MRRYPLNYRSVCYNEGSFYTLLPAARKPVAPGERISSMIFQARLLSSVFDRANLTPMLAQAWFFYVPHRLVWPEWIDFIALDDAVTAPPTTATPWPAGFEQGSGPHLSLFRRSFKLAYNQYFGEEQQGASAWFANINDDTDVAFRRLLAWDQNRAATKAAAGYTSQSFAAPVSGGSATISLDDFQRALRNNYARRRQKQTGDKYVDTMRLMGVELDWRVQMAPEFLGSTQVLLQPREKSSSQAVNNAGDNVLYRRAAEYAGTLSFLLKQPKSFAEHGYIVGCVGFRPAYMVSSIPMDALFNGPEDFYRPDANTVMQVEGGRTGERYLPYLKGGNLIGVNNNSNVFVNTPGFYPTPDIYVPITGAGPSQMAWCADTAFKGLTPVRPNAV